MLHSTFFNADILAGIIFLAMGLFIKKVPPRSMKTFYGYRTDLSTRNKDMWDEANQYAARYSVRLGSVLLPVGLIMGFIFKRQTNLFWLLTVGIVIVSAMLLLGNTEWHLTQTFDEEGNRKVSQ